MARSDATAIANALVALLEVVPQNLLPDVCDRALALVAQSGGDVSRFGATVQKALEQSGRVAVAVLTTPSGNVGEARRASIAAALQQRIGKPVLLTEAADVTLIGGARLKVGDELFAITLKDALEKIVS